MFDKALDLGRWVDHLAELDGDGASEAQLIDHLSVLERLKAAAAAAQARVTDTLATTRSRTEAARGVPTSERCRGLAAEIALARREPGSRRP